MSYFYLKTKCTFWPTQYFHTNTGQVGELDRARDYGFKISRGQKGHTERERD